MPASKTVRGASFIGFIYNSFLSNPNSFFLKKNKEKNNLIVLILPARNEHFRASTYLLLAWGDSFGGT